MIAEMEVAETQDALCFEFLEKIDPDRYWSDVVLDEILNECCVIHERLGGDLRSIWKRGLATRWNRCLARLSQSGRDLGVQLRDRARGISVPYSSVTVGMRILLDGVSWQVVVVKPESLEVQRNGRRRSLRERKSIRVVVPA